MEYVVQLLPFFAFGFVGALVARFTGVALCMLIAPCVLYMGATPVEFLIFMMTFALYNTFSSATQGTRLDLKNMKMFPGWKALIPVVLAFLISVVNPYVAVAVFLLCFLGELGAAMYGRLPVTQQPTKGMITNMCVAAVVVSGIGAALVYAVTTTWAIGTAYYFAWVALMIVVATVVMYQLSKNRNAGRRSWATYVGGLFAFFGLAGLDVSSYMPTVKRSFPTKIESMMPMYHCVAAVLVTLGLTLATHQEKAYLPSIICALGATFAIRIFGLYEHSERGTLSIVAMAFAVLAALVLALVAPPVIGLQGSW